MDITTSEPGMESFGYVMPLRGHQYKGIIDLMKGGLSQHFGRWQRRDSS
jgi:hypothetical protein